MANCEWPRSFLKPHSLSIHSQQSTSLTRVVGFNELQVKFSFKIYGEELAKHTYEPRNIWFNTWFDQL